MHVLHMQKRLFMNFRCKLRHRRSIRRPRFPIRVQNFSDFATFSVDFCILYDECQPCTSGLFDLLTYKYTTGVDPYQVWSWHDHPLPSYSDFICWSATWHCDFDLWPFSRWSDVIHSESRDQPCHQVRRPYAHPCSIPICKFTVQLRWLYDESN